MTAATALDTGVQELSFAHGLPGFPGSRRFALEQWGGPDSPYSLLIDLGEPEVRFLVVPPGVFFPDYAADIDDTTAARLNVSRAEDVLVLVIVTLGETAADATANLLGPVLINLQSHEGLQAVLADSDFGTRVPLKPS